MKGISKCSSECLTISKSCESLLDDEIDRDDLATTLWKNKSSKNDLLVFLKSSNNYYIMHGVILV